MNAREQNDQSGLREYAVQVWGRKFLVVIVFLVVVGGTVGYCVITKAKYTASADLLLTPTLSPIISAANNQALLQTVDVPSDIQVIQSAVLKGIVQRTIPNAPDATATEITTTNVVSISATSTDKNLAAAAATQYARAYIAYEQDQTLKTLTSGEDLVQKHLDTIHLAIVGLTNQLTGASVPTATGIQAQLTSLNEESATLENVLANYQFYVTNGSGTQSGQIISFATVPTKPSSPKTVEYVLIAAILGIVLGIGIAMLAEALSDKGKARA